MEFQVVAIIGSTLIGICPKRKRHHDGGLRPRRRTNPRQKFYSTTYYEACLPPLRPIMMTNMAASFLAGLPLAFALRHRSRIAPASASPWSAAYLVSRFLTLTPPSIYIFFDKTARRFRTSPLQTSGAQTTGGSMNVSAHSSICPEPPRHCALHPVEIAIRRRHRLQTFFPFSLTAGGLPHQIRHASLPGARAEIMALRRHSSRTPSAATSRVTEMTSTAARNISVHTSSISPAHRRRRAGRRRSHHSARTYLPANLPANSHLPAKSIR